MPWHPLGSGTSATTMLALTQIMWEAVLAHIRVPGPILLEPCHPSPQPTPLPLLLPNSTLPGWHGYCILPSTSSSQHQEIPPHAHPPVALPSARPSITPGAGTLAVSRVTQHSMELPHYGSLWALTEDFRKAAQRGHHHMNSFKTH